MNVLRAVAALTSSLVINIAAFAQDAALLPEAQKAFDSGNSAVQQQQWGQAVRHFTDAHKIGGNDPRILLNLGLAHARLGNELHAIGWLNASAAAGPDSPNAKAIPQETQRLKELVLAKIDRLIGLAIAAAEKMPEKETVRLPGFPQDSVVDNYERQSIFASAAAVYAKSGNDERALALYERANTRGRLDELRRQRARALVEVDDFDRALKIIEEISEGFQRNSALADIVDVLLSDRHYAGKVAPEDIAQAQRFLQPLADLARRKQAEARLTRLGLRQRFDDELDKGYLDANLLDQLLAASEESSRPWILQRVAHFQTDKADFAGAQRTIARMGSANPVPVANALTNLTLMQLKAGRRGDAVETARRLAGLVQAHRKGNDAFSIQPLEGVVQAVLGEFNGALQIATRYGVPPNQIYTGIPEYIGFYDPGFTAFNQRQSLVGMIVFCAAMAGRMDDAMRIARQERPVQGLQNYAHTNIAYAHLVQGNLSKAIDAIRTVPVRNEFASDNGRTQILGLILIEHIKRGDLKAAEQTVGQMTGFAGAWKHGARYRVESFIRIARAYHAKAQANEVMRLLDEAKKVVRDGVVDPAVQREGLGDVDELRERIASAQTELGDPAGAAATRAEKTRFASSAVKAWVAFVTSDKMMDSRVLEAERHTLEEVRKPAKGYPSFVVPVEMVAAQLRRIEALERQASGSVSK